jgi:hypothetical protein
VSHSYQTYFGFPESDLNLDCGLRDYVITRFASSEDPLHVPNGPLTRSKKKALKESLNALVLKVSTKSKLKGPLEYQKEALIHLIHM